jgi:hypothetical protein
VPKLYVHVRTMLSPARTDANSREECGEEIWNRKSLHSAVAKCSWPCVRRPQGTETLYALRAKAGFSNRTGDFRQGRHAKHLKLFSQCCLRFECHCFGDVWEVVSASLGDEACSLIANSCMEQELGMARACNTTSEHLYSLRMLHIPVC